MFLIIVSAVIAIVFIYGAYDDFKKTKEKGEKVKNKFTYFLMLSIGIIAAIFCMVSLFKQMNPTTNKWNALTNEEKDWYERNYGNGKSEEIDNAIKDYKENH